MAKTVETIKYKTDETVEQCAERLVRREVVACVSSLVSTLASGSGLDAQLDGRRHKVGNATEDCLALLEQALELASPVQDWEEAATQAGWKAENFTAAKPPHEKSVQWINIANMPHGNYATAQEACEAHDIEPYEWEVFEHWAVSDWLADRLTEQGERVERDFANLNVWARTCTGQGIAMDGSLLRIAAGVLRA